MEVEIWKPTYMPVLPLMGGQCGLKPTQKLGVQLTLLQPGGGADYATTLLLAHPDLETQWQLCTYADKLFASSFDGKIEIWKKRKITY